MIPLAYRAPQLKAYLHVRFQGTKHGKFNKFSANEMEQQYFVTCNSNISIQWHLTAKYVLNACCSTELLK
jgi:hypothetical protein